MARNRRIHCWVVVPERDTAFAIHQIDILLAVRERHLGAAGTDSPEPGLRGVDVGNDMVRLVHIIPLKVC